MESRISAILLLVVSLLTPLEVFAATCKASSMACVDSTPCKQIGAVNVCLSTVNPLPAGALQSSQPCWQVAGQYSCLAQNPVDYCAAIGASPGCSQISSVCTVPNTTPGAPCMRWTNTYQCGNNNPAAMIGTVVLNSTYTASTDPTAAPRCVAVADNPTCTLAETVNGVPSYSCLSVPSTCTPLQAKGCTQVSSSCVNPKGGTSANCLLWENAYSCAGSGPTTTVMDCGGNQYCTGGNCFNTGHAPDNDFAMTVASMEINRQAATYVDPNQRIFNGEAGSCNHNSLGRCCDPKGGAVRNSSLGGQIITTVGGQILSAGSAYMFDAASTAFNAARGVEAVSTAAVAAGSSYSMGAYGLTVTYTAGVGGAAGTFSYSFDPTTFAIAVAIYIIIDLSSCQPDEKVLAKKNGAGLCRLVSETCNGVFCASVTKRYCCFNSKLAKIINNAGVSQLGRPNADCSGLTMAQFGQIDFSKIDFSEFTADIMANVQLPSTGPMNTDANLTIQQKLKNYLKTGKQ